VVNNCDGEEGDGGPSGEAIEILRSEGFRSRDPTLADFSCPDVRRNGSVLFRKTEGISCADWPRPAVFGRCESGGERGAFFKELNAPEDFVGETGRCCGERAPSLGIVIWEAVDTEDPDEGNPRGALGLKSGAPFAWKNLGWPLSSPIDDPEMEPIAELPELIGGGIASPFA
jgi:hypothetical protein